MQIQFFGAAQTVTGSQHLISINGKRLLLECGLFQGKRSETYERNRTFAYDPQEVDAVILSHAHIDHSGNLPHLVKRGFAGPIFATRATSHLAQLMLLDSGHIHESDAEFVNKKRKKRGEPLIEPLYTKEDAAQVAQYFQAVDYDQVFEPAPGVTARLVEAGHILGSAAVALELEERGRRHTLWFSGDIGRRNLPLIRDPQLPDQGQTLVMECTYGDKPHRDPEIAFQELRQAVIRTLERGGKVIIPAFAVGRTQELVYNLNRMIVAGDIPGIPVYVDSPLAVNATDIFRQHPECFDQETQDFVRGERHRQALGFDRLTYVRSVDESRALNDRKDSMVIIAASGMAETGRILHHLRHNIENKRNTILIVSWQAPYTLGRRLADRDKVVKIFGEEFHLNAEVATIGGLSAHAGQDLLTEYALALKGQVNQIFLVHGEANPAAALTENLRQRGLERVFYPARQDTFELS